MVRARHHVRRLSGRAFVARITRVFGNGSFGILACGRLPFRICGAFLIAASVLAMPALAAAEQPLPKAVSINLCADQLALLLAAPGQLLSVSHVAADPLSSPMAEEAARLPLNHGGAEEVFLLHPDVVLAARYSPPTTLALLERLGIPTVRVPEVNALDDIPEALMVVARALDRREAAERLIDEFHAGLRALAADASAEAPRAVLYYPNGYTAGQGTLGDSMLRHAGLRNIAAELGISGGGTLALETLVLAAPEVIITSARYPGASRAEEILRHPALMELRGRARRLATTDGDWVCGTPHALRAVRALLAVTGASGG